MPVSSSILFTVVQADCLANVSHVRAYHNLLLQYFLEAEPTSGLTMLSKVEPERDSYFTR